MTRDVSEPSRFRRSTGGLAYDIDLHESAERLHQMYPELDPAIFTAYLTLGRTWNALSKLGDKFAASLGLTAYQRHSLRFLLVADDQRLTLGDLAAKLETTSANTTKLVNRMQKSGLVRREVDADDRRVVWVVLTEQGRQKYMAALPVTELDRKAFSVLNSDERDVLIDLLTRVQEQAIDLWYESGNASMGQPATDSRRPGKAVDPQPAPEGFVSAS